MQPASHRRAHGFEIGLQAVIACDEHDLASRPRWGDAERIPLALDDEGRYRHGVELSETALGRAPRGLKREGEAENTDGAGGRGSAARHPSAERATADDEREVPQLAGDEVLDDRDEGSVEPPSGRR